MIGVSGLKEVGIVKGCFIIFIFSFKTYVEDIISQLLEDKGGEGLVMQGPRNGGAEGARPLTFLQYYERFERRERETVCNYQNVKEAIPPTLDREMAYVIIPPNVRSYKHFDTSLQIPVFSQYQRIWLQKF